MRSVLLLGAGKIGVAIAKYLSEGGDYDLTVADAHAPSLERIASFPRVRTLELDTTDEAALHAAIKGRQAVLSALPYQFNGPVVRACLEHRVSYFDLTEDVANTRLVKQVAAEAPAGVIFMPQCGLAPGFVSITAYHLARGFDTLDEVRLRVGALPQYPTNQFKYNLTWSTDGLIHEYCALCEAVRDYRKVELQPLEGYERLNIEGQEYEAFNTSGGVGSLPETLEGKVRNLDYKTIRYPGHRDLLVFLLNELKLREDEDLAKSIIEKAVPATTQDVVLIYCVVKGTKHGRLTQVSDVRKVYAGQFMGMESTAIQVTTAAGICACVDLHFDDKLPKKGFVRQEDVNLPDFLANRFGKAYEQK